MLSHSNYQIVWDQNLNGVKLYRLVNNIPTAITDNELKTLITSYLNSAFGTYANNTDGIIHSGTGDGIINFRFINLGDKWGQTTTEPAGGGISEIRVSPWKFTDQAALMNAIYGNCNTGDGYAHLYTVILHEMYHVFNGAGEAGYCINETNVRAFCCEDIKTNLTECDIDAVRNAYNPKHNITVKNSFGAGGDVRVDGTTYTNIPITGKIFDQWRTTSFPHTLEAIDKLVPENGIQYWRRFQHWRFNDIPVYSGRTYSIPVSDGIYTARMLKEFNVVFQNSFIGVGNVGSINVNYTNYNSPKTSPVLETYSIVAAPINQVINGIQYIFTQWNDGVINYYRTFYPDNHITYTANYIGKPLSSILNVDCNDIVGQPVTLTWTEHPNINVTYYQVWRKVKHNGVVGPAVLRATKTRGNTSFVDNQYEITNGYTDDLLFYDVRPFYSIENTYSDPNWLAVYGEELYKKIDSTSVKNELEISKLSISCFPNPFNPSTNIRVIHPKAGFLEISIYSILGEKVKQLLNQVREKGIYEFNWTGTDNDNNPDNSGLYIINVKTDYNMLSKKIVFLK